MIIPANLKDWLQHLQFEVSGRRYRRAFAETNAYLEVDFASQQLIYPEDQGFCVNERQSCNFSANENFVVFECVYRSLAKGYKPNHIELQPKWKLGHGASGGRSDILVKDNHDQALLIIECKTPGREIKQG